MSNRIHEAFDSVHASQQLKARTLQAVTARMYPVPRRRRASSFRLAAALCCLVLIFSGAGGALAWFTPVAAISLDINPSLELSINRFDRVVSVTCYNQDAQALIDGLNLNYQPYDQAVTTLMESEAMSDYRDGTGELSVTVVCSDPEKTQELESAVTACAGNGWGRVSCHTATQEQLQEAHDCGLSFGKYQALLELQALDPSITAEDIEHMSMYEIRQLILDLSGTSSEPSTQSGQGGQQGQGNQNGQQGNQSGQDNQQGQGQGNQYGQHGQAHAGQGMHHQNHE